MQKFGKICFAGGGILLLAVSVITESVAARALVVFLASMFLLAAYWLDEEDKLRNRK